MLQSPSCLATSMGDTPAQAPAVCHPHCCSSLPTALPASAYVPSQSVLNTTARVMLQKYVTSRYLSARNSPAASPPTHGETQSPVLCGVTSCSHPLLSPLSHQPPSSSWNTPGRVLPQGLCTCCFLRLKSPSLRQPHTSPHPCQTFIQVPPPGGGFAWSP